jgi:hypothetical protein
MAITAPAPEDTTATRTCKTCGEEKGLDAFVKTNGGSGRLHKCKACRSVERKRDYFQGLRATGDRRANSGYRDHRARMNTLYGHHEVRRAPDPAPAALLCELLADSRRCGLTFEEAFAEDCTYAVEGLRRRAVREDWLEAFSGVEPAWRAAYERLPGPGAGLSPALLDAVSQSADGRDEHLG